MTRRKIELLIARAIVDATAETPATVYDTEAPSTAEPPLAVVRSDGAEFAVLPLEPAVAGRYRYVVSYHSTDDPPKVRDTADRIAALLVEMVGCNVELGPLDRVEEQGYVIELSVTREVN